MRYLAVLAVCILIMTSTSGCFGGDDDEKRIKVIEFNYDKSWDDIHFIVGKDDRFGGGMGELEAAVYVEEKFKEAGLANVKIHNFSVPCYEVNDAYLALIEYDNFGVDSITEYDHMYEFTVQGYSGSRAYNDWTDDVPIIHCGNGSDDSLYADADGKAVIVTSDGDLSFTELWIKAWENGAAANIIHNVHIHEKLDFVPIGFTGALVRDNHSVAVVDVYPDLDIPSMMVSYDVGDEIQWKAQDSIDHIIWGDTVKLRIDFDVTVEERDTYVVTGDLEGRGKHRNEIVMLGGHIDAAYVSPGAVDNACGVGTITEIARSLGSKKTDRTIRFAAWGSEENGMLGSYEYYKANPYIVDNMTVYMNFDMINVDLTRGNSITMGATSNKLIGKLKTAVGSVKAKSKFAKEFKFNYYVSNLTGGSDQATFTLEGSEAIVYWGSGAWEYHTPWDDMGHINKKSLEVCGRIMGSLALNMAGSP